MASFSSGLEEIPQPERQSAGRPRAKLSHLRNYRFCEELEPDKRGTPQVVRVRGATWMQWRRCAGSEWYELEDERAE